jgi:hypothetical protein
MFFDMLAPDPDDSILEEFTGRRLLTNRDAVERANSA